MMVNTRNNPAVQAQGEANAARAEDLPQPPSLAEVMLEAERNKRNVMDNAECRDDHQYDMVT